MFSLTAAKPGTTRRQYVEVNAVALAPGRGHTDRGIRHPPNSTGDRASESPVTSPKKSHLSQIFSPMENGYSDASI